VAKLVNATALEAVPWRDCGFESRRAHPSSLHLNWLSDGVAPPPFFGRVVNTSGRAIRRPAATQIRGPPEGVLSDALVSICPANPTKRGPAQRKLPGPWPKER
jgi:hypothetical protein